MSVTGAQGVQGCKLEMIFSAWLSFSVGQQALGELLSALSRDETCSKLLDLEIRYEQETRGHRSNTASDSEDGEEGEGPEKSQR